MWVRGQFIFIGGCTFVGVDFHLNSHHIGFVVNEWVFD